MEHRSGAELDAGLGGILEAPRDVGRLDLIVRRPGFAEREVLEEGELDLALGLLGDTWSSRPSRRTADGSPHPDMQLNVMSSRVIAAIAGVPERWALAGDQLFVDLDLSVANLPAGTALGIGTAVIEVTDQPHTGCPKFTQRFGADALRWVNGEVGRPLRLRGLNARVVQPGTVRRGDAVVRLLGQPGVSAAMTAGTSAAGTAGE